MSTSQFTATASDGSGGDWSIIGGAASLHAAINKGANYPSAPSTSTGISATTGDLALTFAGTFPDANQVVSLTMRIYGRSTTGDLVNTIVAADANGDGGLGDTFELPSSNGWVSHTWTNTGDSEYMDSGDLGAPPTGTINISLSSFGDFPGNIYAMELWVEYTGGGGGGGMIRTPQQLNGGPRDLRGGAFGFINGLWRPKTAMAA